MFSVAYQDPYRLKWFCEVADPLFYFEGYLKNGINFPLLGTYLDKTIIKKIHVLHVHSSRIHTSHDLEQLNVHGQMN